MPAELPPISVVVIGRNEGERLVRCMQSVRSAEYPADKLELTYVDSGSTDGSAARAAALGARVIRTQPQHPTAAAARNAGLEAAACDLVQFLDGDTILAAAWLHNAAAVMANPSVTAVYGRCEELAPQASIYNFWAHHDWYVPPGRVESSGGNLLVRRAAVVAVGGYDAALIAGEERDLSYRLIRDQSATILCLDEPMILHDIGMTRFSQYWRRCIRTGHAYAEVGARYPRLHSWRRTRRHNILHVSLAALALTSSCLLRSPWPLIVWLTFILLAVSRNALRCRERVGSLGSAWLYSFHHYFAKLPTVVGQCNYWLRRIARRAPQPLIEFRGA